jgi:hypothetical protein
MDITEIVTVDVVTDWAGPVVDRWVDARTALATMPPSSDRDWLPSVLIRVEDAGILLLLSIVSRAWSTYISVEAVGKSILVNTLFRNRSRLLDGAAEVALPVLAVWAGFSVQFSVDLPTTVIVFSSATCPPSRQRWRVGHDGS